MVLAPLKKKHPSGEGTILIQLWGMDTWNLHEFAWIRNETSGFLWPRHHSDSTFARTGPSGRPLPRHSSQGRHQGHPWPPSAIGGMQPGHKAKVQKPKGPILTPECSADGKNFSWNQGGAPKIAKLLYNSNNSMVYGWYIYSYIMGVINQFVTGGGTTLWGYINIRSADHPADTAINGRKWTLWWFHVIPAQL